MQRAPHFLHAVLLASTLLAVAVCLDEFLDEEASAGVSSSSMPTACPAEDRALLQASRTTRIAAEDAAEADEGAVAPLSFLQVPEACSWTIFHGKWLTSFEPVIYRHAGDDCLAACCEDSSCLGVGMMSSGHSDCHRFVSVPKELKGLHGMKLGDGRWLHHARPLWSVIMKEAVAPAAVPSVGAHLQPHGTSLIINAALPQECQWEVHYDRWIKTFEGADLGRDGEYEHPGPEGGAHCLIQCCQDPTCTALELMSNERFQCYKFSQRPSPLKGVQGIPLEDGKWLAGRLPKWSIFVKVAGVGSAPVDKHPEVRVPQLLVASPPPQRDFSLLWQLFGVLAVIAAALQFATTESLKRRVAFKLGLSPSQPECRNLIETVPLQRKKQDDLQKQ